MRAIQAYRPSVFGDAFHVLNVFKHHASSHLVVADVEQLYRFNKHVGEVAVEALHDVATFRLCLVGECCGNIGFDQPPAVAHHRRSHPSQRVGQRIERAERQQSHSVQQQPKRRVCYALQSRAHTISAFIRSSCPRGSTRRTFTIVLLSRVSAGTATRR